MIITNNIVVNAEFDTGTFLGIALSVPIDKRIQEYDGNIQQYYNLSMKNFEKIELLIATVLNKYFKEKEI